MADKTQEARTRRASGRDQRRSRVAEQFEELDQSAQEHAEGASAPNGQIGQTAAKVVGSVVAAALLGAAAAAAKGLLERQRGDEEQQPDGARSAEDDAGSEIETDQSSARDEHGADPEASDQPEDEASEVVEDEGEEEQEQEQQQDQEQPEPVQGAGESELEEVVAQARRQLQGLVGAEPERVSGVARANGGWSVMLEVVEVARVPESTDVLATYELRLDDELNVVTVNRGRRYRRSQVDEAS
jgi:gas vesicle protein GvpO